MKKIKIFYNNFINFFNKRRIKKSITALFFTVLAFLTKSIFIVYIICLILGLIFSLISLRKKQRLGIITFIICLILICFSFFKYITRDKDEVDPNKGTNVLIGKWEYNNNGGFYSFEKNMSYVQYTTDNTDDNFCYGTYKYEYGYETDDGKLIRSDIDYTYYLLILSPKKCIINNEEDTTKESKIQKDMVFGYGTVDKNKSIIINITTDNYYIVNKIKE